MADFTELKSYCPFRNHFCIMECALFVKNDAYSGKCSLTYTADIPLKQDYIIGQLEDIKSKLNK